jgi:hypothetical protein
MKALVMLLFAAVIVVSCVVYTKESKIIEQNRAIADLNKEIGDIKRARSMFDSQERCAEQARKTFDDLGYKKKPSAGYENHYNETMNKCFIAISDTEPSTAGAFFTSRMVFDALEGKTYGEYMWRSDKKKKFWEVPPFMCRVTSPSGEQHRCQSDEEFKELLKPYMDIS